MKDFTFFEEAPDKMADGTPNLLKLFRLGRQLLWFRHFTRVEFGFTLDINVQKVLMDFKPLSDDELYKYSLLSEPKTISAHIASQPPPKTPGIPPSKDLKYIYEIEPVAMQ